MSAGHVCGWIGLKAATTALSSREKRTSAPYPARHAIACGEAEETESSKKLSDTSIIFMTINNLLHSASAQLTILDGREPSALYERYGVLTASNGVLATWAVIARG